jgi:hypothetical protein
MKVENQLRAQLNESNEHLRAAWHENKRLEILNAEMSAELKTLAKYHVK